MHSNSTFTIMGNVTRYVEQYPVYSFGLTIKRAVSELECVCELVTTWGFMLAKTKTKKEIQSCFAKRSLTPSCYS